MHEAQLCDGKQTVRLGQVDFIPFFLLAAGTIDPFSPGQDCKNA